MYLKHQHLKQLSVLLLCCFLLTFLPAGLLHAETTLQAGTEDELISAVESARVGDKLTIELTDNITLSQPITLNGKGIDVTINGSSGGAEPYTIQFAGDGFFVLEEGASLLMQAVILEGNTGPNMMFAVLEAELTLYNVTLEKHTIDSTVDDDTLEYRGAIEAYWGEFGSDNETRIEITDSILRDNVRSDGYLDSDKPYAGALYLGPGVTAVLDGVTLERNKAEVGAGAGAVVVESEADHPTTLTIQNCDFKKNYGYNGGALHVTGEGANVTIDDSYFDANSAGYSGGAIFVEEGQVTINTGDFENNTAEDSGGAMAVLGGFVTVDNDTFIGSNNASAGGGIFQYGGYLAVLNSDFNGNLGDVGAAVYHLAGTFQMEGGNVAYNTGTEKGAALYFESKDEDDVVGFVDVYVTGNKNTGDGAVFYIADSQKELILGGSTNITDNTDQNGPANLLLAAGTVVKLLPDQAPTDDFDVHLATEGSLADPFTEGYGDLEDPAAPEDLFTSDDPDYAISGDNGEIIVAEGADGPEPPSPSDPETKMYTVTPVWSDYYEVPEGASLPSPFTAEEGSVITPPELLPVDGIEFQGWYYDKQGLIPIMGDITLTEDITIFGVWVQPEPSYEKHTLSFAWIEDPEPPAIDPPADQTYENGENIEPPSPLAEGYVFKGWFYDEDATAPLNEGDGLWSDTTLYGLWEKIEMPQCTLSFAWIGEVPNLEPPQPQTYDVGVVIQPPSATAEGYTFEGWFYDKNADSQLQQGDVMTGDTTLYGLWTKNQPASYTIRYAWATGPEPVDVYLPASQQVQEGEALPQPDLSSKYYTFKGWYEDKAATTPLAKDAIVKQDQTIYGLWAEKEVEPKKFTITYAWGDGPRPDDATLPGNETVEEGKKIPQPNLTGKDHTFKGWYEDKAGKTKLKADATADKDRTIYAIWEKKDVAPKTYKISYAWVTGGEIPAAATLPAAGDVEAGTVIPAPDLTAKGYTFHGWFVDSVGKTQLQKDAKAEKDMTLYGKWTKDIVVVEYTIDFAWTSDSDVPKGAKLPEAVTVKEGELLPGPTLEVKDYTFHGWFKDKEGTKRVKVGAVADEDMTLYGKWSKNPPEGLTVTFDMNGHGTAPDTLVGLAWGTMIDKPQKPTADGWVFKGWYKDAATTVPWNFQRDTVTGDTVLYARWHRASDPAELIALVGELRITLTNIRANDVLLTEYMVDRDNIHLRAEPLNKLPQNLTNREVMGRGFYYVFDIGFERRTDTDRLIDRIDGSGIEAQVTISLGGQRDKEVDAYVLERDGDNFKLTACPVIRTGDDYTFNGPHFSVYVLTFNAPGEKETTAVTTPEATTPAPTTQATTQAPTTAEKTTVQTTPLETVHWETETTPERTTKTMEAPSDDKDDRPMVPLTTVFIILGVVILLLFIAIIALVVTRRE